jgi:hypothetical protein
VGGQAELHLGPELGDQVVVVGVEPLGHLHGGGVVAAPGHGEVGVQVDGLPRGFDPAPVALGDGADQDAGVEHLVVEREVVGGDLVEPGVAQERPALAAQLPGRRLQLLGRHPPGPVALGRGLQLPAVADPREPGNGCTHVTALPRGVDWPRSVRGRWQVFGLVGGRRGRAVPGPTGRRFPNCLAQCWTEVRVRLDDGCRSHSPLRGSSGFAPDSLFGDARPMFHGKQRPGEPAPGQDRPARGGCQPLRVASQGW